MPKRQAHPMDEAIVHIAAAAVWVNQVNEPDSPVRGIQRCSICGFKLMDSEDTYPGILTMHDVIASRGEAFPVWPIMTFVRVDSKGNQTSIDPAETKVSKARHQLCIALVE